MQTAIDASARQKQLDGLRGVAALSVFWLHTLELVDGRQNPKVHSLWGLLQPFWDGGAAVALFFVLSGFVLALPYVGSPHKQVDTIPFIIRRITRLYPAYWVAILLALFMRFAVFAPQGLAGLGPWVNALWHIPIDPLLLAKHFVMLAPNLQTDAIDPVIWSLIAEVKISLIFPAVLILLQKTKTPWYAVAVLALSSVCDVYLRILGHLTIFLFGAYLAKYRAGIVSALSASGWLKAGAAVCGYLLYNAAWTLPFVHDQAQGLLMAVGGCLCIALFLQDRFLEKIFKFRPVELLGDVSYSFYLIHLPVLLTLTSLLYPRTGSKWFCIAASLACSLVLSYAIYRLVEAPAQNWGRKQAKAVGVRISARAIARQSTASEVS